MIRGAQKKMIVVKTEGSRLFDEAYFILRRDAKENAMAEAEILSEADKIFRESAPGVRSRRRGGRRLPFLLGLFLGVILAIFLLLLKKALHLS